MEVLSNGFNWQHLFPGFVASIIPVQFSGSSGG